MSVKRTGPEPGPGMRSAAASGPDAFAAEQVARSVRRYNLQARDPATVRSYAEVARFFDGLDLVEPGLVQLHRWRAEADGLELPNYGGVGRKP
jgi:S-adenosyl methyltransferase